MGSLGVAYHHAEIAVMDALFEARIAKLDKHERCALCQGCGCIHYEPGGEVGIQYIAPIGGALTPEDVWAAHDAAMGFEGDPDDCAFDIHSCPCAKCQPERPQTVAAFVAREEREARRLMRRVLYWVLLVGSVGVSVVCWVVR